MNSPELFRRVFLFAFLFSIISFTNSFAQKEANVWHFGYQSGMEFSSGTPMPISNSAMDAFEGCSSICDENGNLLFYTNGGGAKPGAIPNGPRSGLIWNRNHEVMYNMGDDEGGGYSAAQNSIILPVPGSNHEYYLFTMDHQPSISDPNSQRGLSYFIVDMNLNGGLGGVSVANQLIFQNSTETLTATLHENGTDYWVIAVDKSSEDFVVVHVTANGVQSPFLQPRISNELALVTKISPDGQFLCTTRELYRFNKGTGAINFVTNLPESNYYTYSFSASSRYLYQLDGDLGGNLIRYDLTANDIASSKETLFDLGFVFPGYMQLGPDGNIYFNDIGPDQAANSTMAVSVIYCPDADTPSMERAILEFPTEPGIGTVIGLTSFADFFFKEDVSTVPEYDTLGICIGETLTMESTIINGTYLWSTGATASTITTTLPGTYEVTVTNSCGNVLAIQSFIVEEEDQALSNQPLIEIEICETIALNLEAPQGSNYVWSTGETTEEITISNPGNYSVTATEGCTATLQEFKVIQIDLPVISIVADSNQSPCHGEQVLLTAMGINIDSILWSTGETTQSILGEVENLYAVEATNACGNSSSEIILPAVDCCEFFFPNAFSPNADGINDFFQPYSHACDFDSYNLKIFSRWGELIFETNDPGIGWDGNFRGKKMPTGICAYQLIYSLHSSESKQSKNVAGDVVVLY